MMIMCLHNKLKKHELGVERLCSKPSVASQGGVEERRHEEGPLSTLNNKNTILSLSRSPFRTDSPWASSCRLLIAAARTPFSSSPRLPACP